MAKDLNGKTLPKGIVQRKDGLYMARFQYEGEMYSPIYDKNLKAIEKKLNDLKYEVTHQLYAQSSKITVDEWYRIWMEKYRGIRIKPATKEIYNNNYNFHIKEVIGKKKVSGVKVDHIQSIYNNMAMAGMAEGTIKIVGVVLYGLFKQAMKLNMINKNPVELATIPKGRERKERIALTREQQSIFQNYIQKYSEYYRLFLVAFYTGMRNGEVRGLCWNDIDFETRVIHVTGTMKYIQGMGYFKGSPKTKTSKRDIPMIGSCYELLVEQKEQ